MSSTRAGKKQAASKRPAPTVNMCPICRNSVGSKQPHIKPCVCNELYHLKCFAKVAAGNNSIVPDVSG